MKKGRFYYCSVCGNIIEKVHDSGNDLECCARTMNILESGITNANPETHVPVCKKEGNNVTITIGNEAHPMTKEHHIEWVEIVTNKGWARKYLSADEQPVVKFSVQDDEEILKIYAYCNIHKLWKCTICQ